MVLGWAPNPKIGVFIGKPCEDTEIQRGDRDRRQGVLDCQPPSEDKRERAKKQIFSQSLQEPGTQLIPGVWTPSLQNCERIKFSSFKSPSLWHFIRKLIVSPLLMPPETEFIYTRIWVPWPTSPLVITHSRDNYLFNIYLPHCNRGDKHGTEHTQEAVDIYLLTG